MDERWRDVRRLLALRLDQLGDLLMTTPALAALRESLPHATITLGTSPGAAAAAPHLPMVDAVWPLVVPWMPGGADADVGALVQRIAGGGFDAAVVFTVCTQSALPAATVLRLAGVPRVLAHVRENAYALLSDAVPDPDRLDRPPVRHEVERQLALVARIGARSADTRLRFEVLEDDRERVAALLRAEGVGAYAVLHPGASAPSRRWPAARFGTVARALAAQGVTPVFCGGAGEAGLVAEALPPLGAVSLAGRLSLGELAALIERARVVVANNSGPQHLAAALGTPVVSLYALTNPQHGPWQVASRVLSHDVPCRNCLKSVCPEVHHACLRGVAASEAAAAAIELLRPGVARAVPEVHGP